MSIRSVLPLIIKHGTIILLTTAFLLFPRAMTEAEMLSICIHDN